MKNKNERSEKKTHNEQTNQPTSQPARRAFYPE